MNNNMSNNINNMNKNNNMNNSMNNNMNNMNRMQQNFNSNNGGMNQMNNFNTMMEIAVGLNMASVARLVKTWGALDAKTKARYDEIMQITQHTYNYRNYRERLKTVTFPVLPYLGLILRDLTFIEDGNKNYLEELPDNMNFYKMRMLAKVFKSVRDYQRHPFYFTPVPALQHYLLHVRVEQNDNELYKLSCQCEISRNSVKLSSANGT